MEDTKRDARAIAERSLPTQQEWRRDKLLTGHTMNVKLQKGELYITANFDSTSMREVFVNLGRTGEEEKSYTEAMGRLISKYLQIGGTVEEVVASLKGTKSDSSIAWDRGMKFYSVPDAIAKALEVMAGIVSPSTTAALLKDNKNDIPIVDGKQTTMTSRGVHEGSSIKPDRCPSCKEDTLVNENGCFTCVACSYSKCE